MQKTKIFAYTEYYSAAVDLQLGDVDYSGTITQDDGSLVLKFSTLSQSPSQVQSYLADYNEDGIIDSTDARLIMAATA